MNIEIEIKTKHLPTVFMLKNDSPDWANINVPPVRERRDGISEPWAIAIVSITASIPAAVVAAWMLNKIINKDQTTITINRKVVELKESEIVKVIEETMKIEQ